MSTLLIKNAYLVTMDNHQREIPEGGLLIRDGFIEQVGATSELPQTADEILNLKDHIVLPGLVNTHHHFYQTLTRAVPAAQDVGLGQGAAIMEGLVLARKQKVGQRLSE